MRLLLALLFGTTLLLAAPVPKEKPKVKDSEAIVGTWKIDKFDLAGSSDAPPQTDVDSMRFSFEKDNVMNLSVRQRVMKGTFKIDPTAEPKTLDIVFEDEKNKTLQCLYELDGETLKIAIVKNPNTPRPKELKSDGKEIAVITFSRAKEEKKDK